MKGLVAVRFVVKADRILSDITIVEGKDFDYSLPEEALRLIKKYACLETCFGH
ncbi:MAG: hypothetical protein JNM21_00110 [Taibaiella sp.]|nr:hypothetical protein [Taibaiella sp.]